MMSIQQFVFALFMLAPLVSGHLGGHMSVTQLTQDMSPRVFCGRALARMIATICYDDTSNGSVEKRSEATMYGALIPPYYKEQENHIGWPWMTPKASALGSIRGKRFISGGVADECCDKPCSVSELLYYC